jgi:hypothetical protein
MQELRLQHLCTLDIMVGRMQAIGAGPQGERRIAEVTGGTFQGPRLNGRILPGGADWILVRPDGVTQLDVRVTLETNDGALIYLSYRGLRHGPPEVMEKLARGETVSPSDYYFRTTPVFETGAPAYLWLNKIIAVGTGDRRPTGPVYTIYEVV